MRQVSSFTKNTVLLAHVLAMATTGEAALVAAPFRVFAPRTSCVGPNALARSSKYGDDDGEISWMSRAGLIIVLTPLVPATGAVIGSALGRLGLAAVPATAAIGKSLVLLPPAISSAAVAAAAAASAAASTCASFGAALHVSMAALLVSAVAGGRAMAGALGLAAATAGAGALVTLGKLSQLVALLMQVGAVKTIEGAASAASAVAGAIVGAVAGVTTAAQAAAQGTVGAAGTAASSAAVAAAAAASAAASTCASFGAALRVSMAALLVSAVVSAEKLAEIGFVISVLGAAMYVFAYVLAAPISRALDDLVQRTLDTAPRLVTILGQFLGPSANSFVEPLVERFASAVARSADLLRGLNAWASEWAAREEARAAAFRQRSLQQSELGRWVTSIPPSPLDTALMPPPVPPPRSQGRPQTGRWQRTPTTPTTLPSRTSGVNFGSGWRRETALYTSPPPPSPSPTPTPTPPQQLELDRRWEQQQRLRGEQQRLEWQQWQQQQQQWQQRKEQQQQQQRQQLQLQRQRQQQQLQRLSPPPPPPPTRRLASTPGVGLAPSGGGAPSGTAPVTPSLWLRLAGAVLGTTPPATTPPAPTRASGVSFGSGRTRGGAAPPARNAAAFKQELPLRRSSSTDDV